MSKTVVARIGASVTAIRTSLETRLRKLQGKSDLKRWGTEDGLFEQWDHRTKRIASLVSPGASVIEFGAGRMALKRFLPPTCSYTPSDLVDRGPGTIVCDLNSSTLPDFAPHDVAVFSGVLEYVNDVPRLVSNLSNRVVTIIASYAGTESNKRNRRAQGWVNDFSSREFVRIFEMRGFRCDYSEPWQSQVVYRFVRG